MGEINKWPQDMVEINILPTQEVEINIIKYWMSVTSILTYPGPGADTGFSEGGGGEGQGGPLRGGGV